MSKADLVDIENRWKEFTVSGNDLFDQGIFEDAIPLYESALTEAEKLASSANKCLSFDIPIVPVFNISCQNISNAYNELGDTSRAEIMLRRAIFFITHLAEQEELSANEQETVQRELPKRILAYVDFCKETNQENKRVELFRDLNLN